MADNDPVEWRLLDDDFSTVLGILPASDGNLYLELNEPGSGALKIPLNTAIASQITEGMFIRCNYRGAARGGFFVDNIRKETATSQEGGGQWLAVSGRGALAILDDAIVWDDGTGATKRTFTGSKAGILVTLINENKARSIITNVEVSFDADEDTDEESWTDDEDLELTVGRSLLEILREFSRAGGIDFTIDIESNGDFTLNAYKDGIGATKNDIYFRVGINCEEVKEERVGTQIKNDMLVKYRDGFTRVSDTTSASAYRRRAKIINIDNAQTVESATTFGAAQLEIDKDPRRSIPITAYDGVSPYAFIDYEIGDYVMLDRMGTETSDRIVGLQLSFDDSGMAHVIVSLNDIITENNIKFGRDLAWLMNQWNTARDAELLEVRFWANIGDPGVAYDIRDTLIVGDKFIVLENFNIRIYDISTGVWSNVYLGLRVPQSVTNIGNVLYIGCAVQLISYDMDTDTITTISSINYTSGESSITGIAALDGKVYFTGVYDTITESGLSGVLGEVIEYDPVGDTWDKIGGGITSYPNAFISDGTNLYAYYSSGVYTWNGTSWSQLGSNFDNTVLCLAVYGSNLLAGGQFTDGIAEWDGATWATFGGGTSGNVKALAVYLTDVYAGGTFTDLGSRIIKYSGGIWWDMAGGTNYIVDHISLFDDDVYVAGQFTLAGDKEVNRIAVYYNDFESLVDYLEKSRGTFDLAEAIHNAIAKTVMAANDEFGMWDSISQRLRKITWSNMLLSIKTYTDTLYGSSTPAGSDTHVQYNDNGAFGGDAGLRYDATNKVVYIGENEFTTTDNGVIVQGGDANSVGHFMETLGTSIASYITGIRGRGEVGDPEPVQADDVIFRMRGRAYDDTGLGQTSAEVRLVATETHSSTAHGAVVEIHATPNGSTTLEKIATIDEEGINLEAGKEYRVNGAQHTHTSDDIADGVVLPATNSNDIFRVDNAGNSIFTATINGTPSGASVVYTQTGGNDAFLVPVSTSQLAKLRLYNTTRGNYALIETCNISTDTITLTANAPANWANGDTITITSQTVVSGQNHVDLEIVSGVFLDASLGYIWWTQADASNLAGITLRIHPFETFVASKNQNFSLTTGNSTFVKLVGNVFSIAVIQTTPASGNILVIRQVAVVK